MLQASSIEFLKNFYQKQGIRPPEFHVVLGSGYGAALDELPGLAQEWESLGQLKFSDVPGMLAATAPDHHGVYRYFKHRRSGQSVAMQLGRLHGYEGLPPRQVVQTVLYPCLAGTSRFLLTNAAGSLRPEWPVGSAMMIKDHVNLTGQNPLAGSNPMRPDGSELGPRFPDLSQAYDLELSRGISDRLKKDSIVVNEGIYLGLLGPSFETPAEVALFARWGLDAVGMSTVWETIALKHAGATVAGLSLLSNLGCGLGDQPLDHLEVLRVSRLASKTMVNSFFTYFSEEFSKNG